MYVAVIPGIIMTESSRFGKPVDKNDLGNDTAYD